MFDWFHILMLDIKDATLEVSLQQLIRPSFFVLWLAILCMPLKGIDRRDTIAGLMFALYCTAAGAMLLFALPQKLLPDVEFRTVLISLLCMCVAACCRWFLSTDFFIEKERK